MDMDASSRISLTEATNLIEAALQAVSVPGPVAQSGAKALVTAKQEGLLVPDRYLQITRGIANGKV